MENENIMEQQAILEELRDKVAREELQKLQSGRTYNTPDTDINAPEPVVDESLQSVSATISVGSINVGITEKLASASASAVVNLPSANVASIQFDYEAVKHRYNKRRTVLLPRVA